MIDPNQENINSTLPITTYNLRPEIVILLSYLDCDKIFYYISSYGPTPMETINRR